MSRVALGFAGDRAICALLPKGTEALAKSADHAEADAVFISCGSMRIRPVLIAVERALGKPVLTTIMAVMWNTLRAIGVKAPLEGKGQLFASPR
jgi:maleate isomerase